MSGGGSASNRIWMTSLLAGLLLLGVAWILAHMDGQRLWLHAIVLGLGGLSVVFAACELLIKAVDGLGLRLRLNRFVAGTLAGLASNIPEVVMLAFVLIATPRVGFLVTVFTLHVSAAAFGIYSALLPRDKGGLAALPKPLVMLSTDLYACAGAVLFVTGASMLLMHQFDAGTHQGDALGATDLYVLGAALLLKQVVATTRLLKRFSDSDEAPQGEEATSGGLAPTLLAIGAFAVAGIVASIVGGLRPDGHHCARCRRWCSAH